MPVKITSEDDDEWIEVDGYKDVPKGDWIVQLEDEHRDCALHVINSHPNISIIGGNFAFDHSRVVAYHPLPQPYKRSKSC